ncbi:hypothetical protein ACS0TY_008309 [Phlomoides rotata]
MYFYGYPVQQMQEVNVHSLEDYREDDDDDGFYDELRRQILQLTAEDDDDVDGDEGVHRNKILEARKQGPLLGPLRYYDWPGIKKDCIATPAWMLSLWRSGNGTGVFIPQTLHSSGKNRSRKNNERGRRYRRVER